MPALRQRFFHDTAACMQEPAQFGGSRGTFDGGAARACKGGSQHLYKHPWCAQSYALAILLLPRFVGDLFQNDRVADRHDLMHVVAMQTLAMGCQLVFSGRLASARAFVALARLPASSVLPLLLHATALVIVLWVGSPPLSIHPTFQPPDGLALRSHSLPHAPHTPLPSP